MQLSYIVTNCIEKILDLFVKQKFPFLKLRSSEREMSLINIEIITNKAC